nr:TIGR02996 domain-containing protein [Kofleriaceae bacterium]
MSEALLAQLVAHPGDLEARRIYGDALGELGDPRGELIAISCAPAERRTPELAAREAALVTQLGDELLERVLARGSLRVDWRHGFVDAIHYDYEAGQPVDTLARLAAEPALRLVRAVVVSACEMDATGTLGAVLDELVRAAPAVPRLVDIEVYQAPNFGSPWYTGAIDVGDVAPLIVAYPRLERLGIGGANVRYGDGDRSGARPLALPALRDLTATHLDRTAIAALVELRTPPLDELTLGFGNYVGVREAGIPLLAASSFAPRRLELMGGHFHANVFHALRGAPLASRLDTFALWSRLTTDDLRPIIDWAQHAPHVTRIELDTQRLARGQLRDLERALGPRLAPPRPPKRAMQLW